LTKTQSQSVSMGATASVLDLISGRLREQPFWARRLAGVADGDARLHLAVFHEPFLSLLFAGTKTVESRFSVNRIAPFGVIGAGDVILLKRSTGPVLGMALAGEPGFYELDSRSWATIRRRFAGAICAPDEAFWAARARARYATLIPITGTVAITPFSVDKRDRRGWVVLPATSPYQQELRACR
jgi:hypothetical protein